MLNHAFHNWVVRFRKWWQTRDRTKQIANMYRPTVLPPCRPAALPPYHLATLPPYRPTALSPYLYKRRAWPPCNSYLRVSDFSVGQITVRTSNTLKMAKISGIMLACEVHIELLQMRRKIRTSKLYGAPSCYF
jgi:hypothetical protein